MVGMNLAVVIGGNGLIGRALVFELIQNNFKIIIVGTSEKIHDDLKGIDRAIISYIRIPNMTDWSKIIKKEIEKVIYFEEGCIFYNLAWRGKKKLMDGGISEKLKNIKLSCDLIDLAKQLKAIKYIVTGSMEELIFEKKMNNNFWILNQKEKIQNFYPLAKVAARRQSSFQAYLSELDYCYTYISVVIEKKLNVSKYVDQSFKKIMNNNEVLTPENRELCNISSSDEVAKQLLAIGKKGKNKRNYILGTEESASLEEYFDKFTQIYKNVSSISKLNLNDNYGYLKKEDFKTINLFQDTGYIQNENSFSLFSEIIQKYKFN